MSPEDTGGEDRRLDPELRSYPAPGRPEQPAHSRPSPWPWVVGGLIIAGVTFGGILLVVMYAIGTSAG